jgi:hypothetical protein
MHTRILSVVASLTLSVVALAQSTAFTYQGELKQGGSVANGLHDLRFSLFDAVSSGVQVGTTQCVNDVLVSDGKFTTTLDFGQQFVTTSSRFLQIEVRQDSGLSCSNTTGFTTLSTRQLLTATPLANHAKSAFALDAADGSPANAVFVDNAGKVGFGTLTPTHSVHVATAIPTIALQDTAAASQQAGYISYRDNANVERAWVGYGTVGSPDFSITNTRPSGKIVIQNFVSGGGSVVLPFDKLGIGTFSPAFPLHIAKLGGIPAGGPVIQLHDTGANGTQSGYLGFLNGSGAETGWIGYGTPGSPHMTMINARAGGDIFITPAAGRAVKVPVLEITGADLAEKFPASEKLEPGTVVAIDRDNAGQLCMSRGAYNRRVAGVVSGANNFSVGAVLGNLPGHEDAPAIALSGRVYVRCDATNGAIEPGDLLTTSDTPGHAMKASDNNRAHGAVIGKAMESLKAGERGLVLVLVNLQ